MEVVQKPNLAGNTELYDVDVASEVQAMYCDVNHVPMFAPSSGICPSCRGNIFSPGHISILRAASAYITGCPICHASFCD